jgi:ribosomal protein L22
MSEENDIETSVGDSSPETDTPVEDSSTEAGTPDPSVEESSTDVSAASAEVEAEESSTGPAAEVEAEAKPKRARKPRAAKPVVEADEAEDEVVAATEAPAEAKPKRTRAAKPKTEEPKKAEAKKPAAKSKPARRGHEEPVAAPVVRAQAKYVRSSARKARLVCDNIRGKSVGDARAILAHTPRAVARDWSKLLESAVANAENNHDLDGEDLLIKAVTADEGPTIKRFRPRAQGRATKIRKRTAHLTILLTPKN